MKNTEKEKIFNKKRCRKLFAILAMVMLCLTGILHQNTSHASGDLEKITASYTGSRVGKGEAIDADDITVRAHYSDGTSQRVYTFDMTPDIMKGSTSQVVKISYSEGGITKVASVTVYCEKARLDSINATYIGNYQIVGAKISSSDVKVVATYEDGSKETVYGWWFGDYSISGGSNAIRIYYKEDGTTQQDTIYVHGVKGNLSRIEVAYTGNPIGIDGYVSADDIKVTAYYKDATKSWGQEVAHRTVDGWTVEPYSIQEGMNTITVSYYEGGQNVMGRCTIPGMKNIATWQYADGKWKFRKANQEYVSSSWIEYRGSW